MLVNMGRPRVHDEATAEALLDAAERIVAADGPEALSTRRVADQAGTTTRAVYSLFESKEGLLVALGNRAFQMLGSWVDSIRKQMMPRPTWSTASSTTSADGPWSIRRCSELRSS